jgi:hypothetical protein
MALHVRVPRRHSHHHQYLPPVVEGVHSPPEITPRQVVCRDRECTPRPDLPVVPPGLRSVVADFMGKSGGSEGGLSGPLIG